MKTNSPHQKAGGELSKWQLDWHGIGTDQFQMDRDASAFLFTLTK